MTDCVYCRGKEESPGKCDEFWDAIARFGGYRDETEMAGRLPPGYALRTHYASDTLRLLREKK